MNIMPISGLDEQGVAQLLSSSKVFMSFSHFEGCPLPPLEAALSGNKVVGYTGQGAREYWHPSIFTSVESGDVIELANAVLGAITQWEKEDQVPQMRHAITELADAYSLEREKFDMAALLKVLSQ